MNGWSEPVYQESKPHAHQLSWTAKNEGNMEMIYVSIIDAPLSDKKPTFKEDALEWEKYILKRLTKKISSSFTTLGGVESYRVVGKTMNYGSEYYVVQWMSNLGQTTYQISLISGMEPNLETGIFHDFITSVKISEKPSPTSR